MFLCIPTAATVSPALCLSCNWSDQWHLTSSPSTHHTQYTRQRNTSSYTQRTKSSTQMGSATAGNMCMYVKQQNSTRFAFVLMFCMAAAFFFFLSFSIPLRSNTNAHTHTHTNTHIFSYNNIGLCWIRDSHVYNGGLSPFCSCTVNKLGCITMCVFICVCVRVRLCVCLCRPWQQASLLDLNDDFGQE